MGRAQTPGQGSRRAGPERGKLAIPFATRDEDGTRIEYDGGKVVAHHGAQLVFAGVEPNRSDYESDGGGDLSGFGAPAIALVVIGLGFVARRLAPRQAHP